jgi:hypothetical protein
MPLPSKQESRVRFPPPAYQQNSYAARVLFFNSRAGLVSSVPFTTFITTSFLSAVAPVRESSNTPAVLQEALAEQFYDVESVLQEWECRMSGDAVRFAETILKVAAVQSLRSGSRPKRSAGRKSPPRKKARS